ncbi:hypothetical protein LguiA_035479 [Lonicera macranthoides]
MDLLSSDRPNRTLTTTTTTSSSSSSNELFICFTSRLSSSSMKLSSKSILSPGRVRDPPTALSTSLSRRLRTNGSIKGGQASPMFPTGAKKRGSTFENPEPSSPKVTCIGQVRVKTKKQGKKIRTLSRKQSAEISFRKLEQGNQNQTQNQKQGLNAGNQHQQQGECLPERNQRWVHLPLTICEALRTFGAEFSCLFPCRSSCFSPSEREKEDKGETMEGQSSCGAVLARWLVALQEGEGRKERDIELAVGGDEGRDLVERAIRNSRRHVFDELEINEGVSEVMEDEVVGKQEEARVSVSVPPKNALLLMRCRSDPNKMAALANRFWESPVVEDEDEEEDGDKDVIYEDREKAREGGGGGGVKDDVEMEEKDGFVRHVNEEQQSSEAEINLYVQVQDSKEEEQQEDLHIKEELLLEEREQEKPEETEVQQRLYLEVENTWNYSLSIACKDQEIKENAGEDDTIQDSEEEEEEEEEEDKASPCFSSFSTGVSSDGETEEESLLEKAAALYQETEESTMEKVTHERSDPEHEETHKEEEGLQVEEREKEREIEKERRLLPDCLLMMMCEPKLSMEVSKETWVCSTDFIRFQPNNGRDDESKNTFSIDSDSNPAPTIQLIRPQLPPRSSCSLPAPTVSIGTMIEEKLINAVGYEPFVLTRCKSAPMRTASKLAPDTCFWKNRNLEPHRRSNFGVGAAGIGF